MSDAATIRIARPLFIYFSFVLNKKEENKTLHPWRCSGSPNFLYRKYSSKPFVTVDLQRVSSPLQVL